MKEFVDKEKTQAREIEVRLRFDRGNDETNKTIEDEEDLPLSTIHMIGAQIIQISKIRSEKRSE